MGKITRYIIPYDLRQHSTADCCFRAANRNLALLSLLIYS